MKIDPGKNYSPEEIYSLSHRDCPSLSLSEDSVARIRQSRHNFEELLRDGEEIYGSTTGFGPLVEKSGHDQASQQADQLISHLGVGTGDIIPANVTRSAMVLRALTLSKGYSAISLEPYRTFIDRICQGIVPVVPRTGSVGASGDLIPMANVILALNGTGEIFDPDGSNQRKPASEILGKNGLDELSLEGRDALALVNGIPFCTALSTFALVESVHLVGIIEEFSAWLYSSLGCSMEAVADKLNSVKGHPEQAKTANNIRRMIETKTLNKDAQRPLQEVYSLRGITQVVGAARKSFQYARKCIQEEINGVDDNPIINSEGSEPEVLHGANFIGQNIAFAADSINASLTQLGNLIESQVSALLDEDQNNGLPRMLTPNPGKNSGLAGLEINATAIVSEMRNNSQNYGALSLETNGRNQDIVPMAMEASWNSYKQVRRLADLLSILGITLSQYDWLHENEMNTSLRNQPDWFPQINPVEVDRPLKDEIQNVKNTIMGGELIAKRRDN